MPHDLELKDPIRNINQVCQVFTFTSALFSSIRILMVQFIANANTHVDRFLRFHRNWTVPHPRPLSHLELVESGAAPRTRGVRPPPTTRQLLRNLQAQDKPGSEMYPVGKESFWTFNSWCNVSTRFCQFIVAQTPFLFALIAQISYKCHKQGRAANSQVNNIM